MGCTWTASCEKTLHCPSNIGQHLPFRPNRFDLAPISLAVAAGLIHFDPNRTTPEHWTHYGPSSKVVTPSGITSHVAFEPTKICRPISIPGSPLTQPNVTPCTSPLTMPHSVEPHLLQNFSPAPCFPVYNVKRSSPVNHSNSRGSTSA
jgi:hypothetical protein